MDLFYLMFDAMVKVLVDEILNVEIIERLKDLELMKVTQQLHQ